MTHGKFFSWVIVIGTVLFFVWYSPRIYHRYSQRLRVYNVCVESVPEADTLGQFWENRIRCWTLARQTR